MRATPRMLSESEQVRRSRRPLPTARTWQKHAASGEADRAETRYGGAVDVNVRPVVRRASEPAPDRCRAGRSLDRRGRSTSPCRRLFPAGFPYTKLTLTSAKPSTTGVIIATYQMAMTWQACPCVPDGAVARGASPTPGTCRRLAGNKEGRGPWWILGLSLGSGASSGTGCRLPASTQPPPQ
jgi:hypothetical protein